MEPISEQRAVAAPVKEANYEGHAWPVPRAHGRRVMNLFSPEHGALSYGAVALAVGLESLGIPFPGEASLIAAATYAGTTHHLSVVLVVAAGIVGAVVGDNIGFLLGRRFGLWLLLRYGHYVRITEPRIKLAQYLFRRFGGGVVFFGRFVAVLRALAAFLAGVNQMPWARFLLFNAAGGIVWASLYGFGAYYFGEALHRVAGPALIGVGAVALGLIVAGFIFIHRHEAELEAEAERALPGPIASPR